MFLSLNLLACNVNPMFIAVVTVVLGTVQSSVASKVKPFMQLEWN